MMIKVRVSNLVFDTSSTEVRYCLHLLSEGYAPEEALAEWRIEEQSLPKEAFLEVPDGSDEDIKNEVEDQYGYPLKSLTIERL